MSEKHFELYENLKNSAETFQKAVASFPDIVGKIQETLDGLDGGLPKDILRPDLKTALNVCITGVQGSNLKTVPKGEMTWTQGALLAIVRGIYGDETLDATDASNFLNFKFKKSGGGGGGLGGGGGAEGGATQITSGGKVMDEKTLQSLTLGYDLLIQLAKKAGKVSLTIRAWLAAKNTKRIAKFIKAIKDDILPLLKDDKHKEAFKNGKEMFDAMLSIIKSIKAINMESILLVVMRPISGAAMAVVKETIKRINNLTNDLGSIRKDRLAKAQQNVNMMKSLIRNLILLNIGLLLTIGGIILLGSLVKPLHILGIIVVAALFVGWFFLVKGIVKLALSINIVKVTAIIGLIADLTLLMGATLLIIAVAGALAIFLWPVLLAGWGALAVSLALPILALLIIDSLFKTLKVKVLMTVLAILLAIVLISLYTFAVILATGALAQKFWPQLLIGMITLAASFGLVVFALWGINALMKTLTKRNNKLAMFTLLAQPLIITMAIMLVAALTIAIMVGVGMLIQDNIGNAVVGLLAMIAGIAIVMGMMWLLTLWLNDDSGGRTGKVGWILNMLGGMGKKVGAKGFGKARSGQILRSLLVIAAIFVVAGIAMAIMILVGKNIDLSIFLGMLAFIASTALVMGSLYFLSKVTDKIKIVKLALQLALILGTLFVTTLVVAEIGYFVLDNWQAMLAGTVTSIVLMGGLLLAMWGLGQLSLKFLVQILLGLLCIIGIAGAIWLTAFSLNQALQFLKDFDWEILGILATAIIGFGGELALLGLVSWAIALGALALYCTCDAIVYASITLNSASSLIDSIKWENFDKLILGIDNIANIVTLMGTPFVFPFIMLGALALLAICGALLMGGVGLNALADAFERFLGLPSGFEENLTSALEAFKRAISVYSADDIIQINAVSRCLALMGPMIGNIAQAIADMAELKIPIAWDEEEKPVQWRQMQYEDFKKAADSIEAIITTIGGAIVNLYDKNEKMFDTNLWGNSPFTKVMDACGEMGDMISDIAEGVMSFANGTYTKYDKNGKEIGKFPITDEHYIRAALNISLIITCIGNTLVKLYKEAKLPDGSSMFDSDSWFEDSPITNILEASSKMGSVISDIAKGIETFANGTYKKYDKNGKEIGTFPIGLKQYDDAAANISKVLTMLFLTMELLYFTNKKFFDGGAFKDSPAEKTLSQCDKVGSLVAGLADGIMKMAVGTYTITDKEGKQQTLKIADSDIQKAKTNISNIILAVCSALARAYTDNEDFFNDEVGDIVIEYLNKAVKSINEIGNMTKNMAEVLQSIGEFDFAREVGRLIGNIMGISNAIINSKIDFTEAQKHFDEAESLISNYVLKFLSAMEQLKIKLNGTDIKAGISTNIIDQYNNFITKLNAVGGSKNFKDNSELMKVFVNTVNDLNLEKANTLINLFKELNTLSERLGGLDKFTQVLSDTLAVQLNRLTVEMHNTLEVIDKADLLQDKRTTAIQQMMLGVADIMNTPIKVTPVTSPDGGMGTGADGMGVGGTGAVTSGAGMGAGGSTGSFSNGTSPVSATGGLTAVVSGANSSSGFSPAEIQQLKSVLNWFAKAHPNGQ